MCENLVFKGPTYFKGKNRNMDCEDQGGLNIFSMEECRTACDKLAIEIEKDSKQRERLRDNWLCYIAGNKKCRQTKNVGNSASRICRKNGNISTYTYYTDTYIFTDR